MTARLALAMWLCAATAFAGSQVTATHAALATASPAATKAGLEVLNRGGNAADAAVAVAFVLSVSYPQASPIGGGGHLLYFDAGQKAVWSLDFSELSPLDIRRDSFAGAAPSGARAASTPGTVAGLEALHRKFGNRPWRELVMPAALLAREGTSVGYALSSALAAGQARGMDKFAPTASLFFPEGKPLAAGAKLVQADLAATLERVAMHGSRDFYEGVTAKKLVDGARAAGALLSFRDLREYRATWRAPLQVALGGAAVYLAPPPAGGGIVIASALQILAGENLTASPLQSNGSVHLIAEATRRAFLDRNRYVGDPTAVRIPYQDLLSTTRAEAWRKTIVRDRATGTATLAAPGATNESANTTHFTIMDAAGNVVSATVTLSGEFGSGLVVPGAGFFLNAAMTNFTAEAASTPNAESFLTASANALASRKRAMWSASPAIVVRDGRAVLALGTPGGATMPSTVLQLLIATQLQRQSLAAAIAQARFHQQDTPEELMYEAAKASPALVESLTAMGHPVAAVETIGDVQAIAVEGGHLVAIADPRHGGAAGGH